jgi:hypothetical protein
MKEAIVIYPARGQGYAFAVSFPKELVESFRALFSLQSDRDWQEPVWCFTRKNLPVVQAWAAQCSEEKQLTLHDVTGVAKARREQILSEIWDREYEEHVAAIAEVLPKLPPGALHLADWCSTHLTFDLGTFLGKPIFDGLKQAALPAGKVPKSKKYIPTQGSRNVRFSMASDPRILKALMPLRIRNLQVQSLVAIRLFENGTGHFQDQDDKLWFGAPYQQLVGGPFDPYQVSSLDLPYTIAVIEEAIYLVVQADSYLERYCLSIAPPYVSAMTPPPSTEKLVTLAELFSLSAWLRTHTTRLLQASPDDLVPYPNSSHKQLWQTPSHWKHPADAFLHYLEVTDHASLLQLLEWDEGRFEQVQAHIGQMKAQKAEDYYLYCQEHAVELMQPLLYSQQRAEIKELASRYGITIPIWPKEKMIKERCTDKRMAEDLLGITEERQRRSTGEMTFTEGIIWGQRNSQALFAALRSGYLSDGTRALSELDHRPSAEGQPRWSSYYALWEDWAARKEKSRGPGLHSLMQKEEITDQDLASWRWFAFRTSDERPLE